MMKEIVKIELEIVKIELENEMDLILANKRTMKLAELCGLSLTIQTALATAVSEIARCALSRARKTTLKLMINIQSPAKKQISAVICDTIEECGNVEAISFAKRLVTEVRVIKNSSSFDIQLNQDLKPIEVITDARIKTFIDYFKTETPLSPYDEIKKKNILLLEFSDKLKESENQYRALADTLPLMMFLINPAGELIYANQWLKDYFGTSLNTGSAFSWQDLVHPDDFNAIHNDWNNIFRTGDYFHAQGRLRNWQSAAYLWHLISIIPVKNEINTVTHWTGFFVDIDAQKLVEETLKNNVELKAAQHRLIDYQKQLEQKIQELNNSNQDLEQFAYIASHDLKEPLRKIVSFSNLLVDKLKDLDKESRTYFSKVIASSKRMTELINDVLDWSKTARTREDFSSVDLNVIVDSVKSDFELLIEEKQAVIETSSLPVVKGMRLQMTQLFSNLIGNALKFCESKPVIKISSRKLSPAEVEQNRKLDQSLMYTEVTVSDNGIGFQQEFSEQIFGIFQRLRGRSEYAGTGIGLALCKKIVESHGGLIFANAMPGLGATFTVIIPT